MLADLRQISSAHALGNPPLVDLHSAVWTEESATHVTSLTHHPRKRLNVGSG